MEILFAVLIIAALFLGWRARKMEQKKWLQTERFEESGDWLDKRASERGTLGALDLEMESERLRLRKSVKTNELFLLMKNFFLENGQPLTELEELKLKNKLESFIENASQLSRGRVPRTVEFPEHFQPQKNIALKTILLDYCYQNFPQLLDLELENILKLDFLAENLIENCFPSLLTR